MKAMTLLPAALMGGGKFDRVWGFIALILLALALIDWPQLSPTIGFALAALGSTAPYLILAVGAIGILKATGAETILTQAFQGQETRMIIAASLIGGLAPFCSCEVIPFIAALLAVGTPLSAVMAIWLSSPLMDPSVFMITAGELGWGFAVAKAVVAVSLGMGAGFAIKAAVAAGYFRKIMLAKPKIGGCCGGPDPLTGKPEWRFWEHPERAAIFRQESLSNGLFLLKWLALAYLLESLMIRYIPAETIASVVGGDGTQPIIVSALVGAPAYLNGYAAPAIVSGLMEQGMTEGAAMAFMVAGGITSIPAMTAVFALVRRQVFLAYLGFGIGGAILAGMAFNAALSWAG